MIFVDASALVAILAPEPDGLALHRRLSNAGRAMTSPVAVWEAAVALARIKVLEIAEAEAIVRDYLERVELEQVAVGASEGREALYAFARFGKGRHPARLNLGDCFAYACARTHGARLLFKGDDFALTDIEPA